MFVVFGLRPPDPPCAFRHLTQTTPGSPVLLCWSLVLIAIC